MPKILRIVNRFNLGGPVFNAAYLTKYLSPSYETLLLGGEKEAHEDSATYVLEQLGIDYQIIHEMKRSVSLYDDYRAYRKICAIINEFKPDIVHTHASKAGLIGRLAAKKMKVPIVVHTYHGHVFHSYFGTLKTNIFINLERYLAKQTTKIIAISEQQKNEIAHYLKISDTSSKMQVIPLGIDTQKFVPTPENTSRRLQFRQHHGIKENSIVIAIIGRLVAVKNHALFLNAFAKVFEKTSKPITAVIVGDGDLWQSLIEQAKALHLSVSLPEHKQKHATVVFTSWIRDIETVYPAVDIVVLTSFNEGTPVSLIEAQAAQKMVVSTDVGGVRDILNSSNNQHILSPSGDIDALAENILYWVEHEAQREEMTQQNAQLVHQQFHFKRLVTDMDMLYQSLLI